VDLQSYSAEELVYRKIMKVECFIFLQHFVHLRYENAQCDPCCVPDVTHTHTCTDHSLSLHY